MSAPIRITPKDVGGSWKCRACGKAHSVSIYVALHMREGLDHQCPCGQRSIVQNWKVASEGERG
ncbi:hypothetical protein JAK52_19460 [Stenotrophomonas maltophilia]|uniref:hypothetical protein n=1 Tax=Stenotrophomonas maltophilia TaxID=40324 RepID=UPI0021C61D2E|nr:hypothetical protein [Stenotrophomonas maltophilia]MCU1176665.1 hypothetical protein [Stenotrophomonas maltophilia]